MTPLRTMKQTKLWLCGTVIILVILLIIFSEHESHVETTQDSQVHSYRKLKSAYEEENHHHPDLAPCGQICSYEGKLLKENGMFSNLQKYINCQNIMFRMGYKNHTVLSPPPRIPPPHLQREFTMNGAMPIIEEQYAEGQGHPNVYSKEQVDKLVSDVYKGVNINTYQSNENCVWLMFQKYKDQITGQSGLVIGTLVPWLEAIALATGAKHVTTLEYGSLELNHPQLKANNPYSYAESFLENKAPLFDFGATFSSLEHTGLGRYGDPINPYHGDLEAMAQAWCMMRPGGLFMVAVPSSIDQKDGIIWNAHRIYGTKRMPHLIANWNYVDHMQCADRYTHVIVVLNKPL